MSFSRAFFPVAIMVLIALVAVIISLGITDRAIKKSNHKLSYHSMALHLDNIQDFQEVILLDYTEWNASFNNLTIKNDMAWFHFSIGGANLLNSRIHGLAFLKNDGTLVAQHTRKNNMAYVISQETFNLDFDVIKQKLLLEKPSSYMTLSYFRNVNGMPALISFSPITPPNPDAYPDFSLDQRDFLVFWTMLTPDLLAQTRKKLRLQNLSITSEQSPDNYALRDSRGNIVSLLKWTLQKENVNPLTLSLYTSFAMFALLLIGGYISFIRVSELIHELNESKAKAERGHKIKSEFLATMSHELRTPLNSIIGFSDILASSSKGNLNGRQAEYIEHIQSSGKHLLNIINEILDMSKIEAGKYELYEVEMNLKQTLNQSIIYLEKNAQDKNITVVKKIPRLLNEFMGDEKVIRQLMLNLLSNSIKFTPEGGQVTVGFSVTENGGLEIYVEDTGIGISPEKIDVITEPYRQDQDHKTRSHQGTGLGLAISKAFVEMHQGTMEIKSELNVGTRVTLTFPASRVLPEVV